MLTLGKKERKRRKEGGKDERKRGDREGRRREEKESVNLDSRLDGGLGAFLVSKTKQRLGKMRSCPGKLHLKFEEPCWCWCCSVAKSCLTLCNPMDCSPPGSPVHGFSRQEYWSGLPFPSPGESSRSRNPIHISFTGRQIL